MRTDASNEADLLRFLYAPLLGLRNWVDVTIASGGSLLRVADRIARQGPGAGIAGL